jgi:hypothetical protein
MKPETNNVADDQIQHVEFTRLQPGNAYLGRKCEECSNDAEFEYGMWFDKEREAEPQTGPLCAVCAGRIMIQESKQQHVRLEKLGDAMRVSA